MTTNCFPQEIFTGIAYCPFKKNKKLYYFDRKKWYPAVIFDLMINKTKHFPEWLLATCTYYSGTVCPCPCLIFHEKTRAPRGDTAWLGFTQLVCSLIHLPNLFWASPACQRLCWALGCNAEVKQQRILPPRSCRLLGETDDKQVSRHGK